MVGYIIGMHRYFRMRKSLLATVSSAEFNTISLNSKLSKVVSYIQDNKTLLEDLDDIGNNISIIKS